MDLAHQDGVRHASQPARPELIVLHVGEQQPHGRIERDRQNRRDDHGKGLGVRQRLEQPAFLRFQRQHRQEGDRDDQQRKEARAADFFDRVDDHPVIVLLAAGTFPFFELLVGLLDHHDGRVHHGPNRDRDPAERHDVGRQAHHLHGNE